MQTLASNMGGNEMNKLKENFGFDFWQKFGKAPHGCYRGYASSRSYDLYR